MEPRFAPAYARALKSSLHANIHDPATARLWWLPVHWAVVLMGICSLALGWVTLPFAWLVSLCVGASFAGLTFLAHETLHGAILRGRKKQWLVGRLAFLPFSISPRLWVTWHNRVHHGHTQRDEADPDAFPTLEVYRNSSVVRFMIDHLGASRGAVGGALALLVGFTIQSTKMLFRARDLGLSRRERRLAILETALSWGLWLSLPWSLGWATFLFGFCLPLLIANTVIMAHILTNHSLSPLTELNDPLLNSLTVTVPRWVAWLTLGFGYHVEHHLFPWMSTRHAPAVRNLLLERWPERYQSMPLLRALKTVYTTPRVYAGPTRLIAPRTGEQWAVCTPGPAASRVERITSAD